MGKKQRPATNPEAQEQELQEMALDLIRKRIEEGTASNALLLQLMKDSSSKTRLEKEKLEEENKLLKAKTAALEADQQNQIDSKEVLDALRRYSGQSEADTPI